MDENKPNIGKRLAAFVARESERSISSNGRFVLAISGGSLPNILAEGLFPADGSGPAASIAWDKWHVFFADERVVPLDHDDSNFKACDATLFSKAVSLMNSSGESQKAETFRSQIRTITMGTPEEAAVAYRESLAGVGGKFDLILLGMGPDGHTASLFPDHPLLEETTVTVASISNSPKPPPNRITLTYPIINSAHTVAFVAAGGSKAENLPKVILPGAIVNMGNEDESSKILSGSQPEPPLLPAARVRPETGNLHWFVDSAAAEQLAYSNSGL